MAKNCPRPECVDGCTRTAWECFSTTPLEETVAPDQAAHVRAYRRAHRYAHLDSADMTGSTFPNDLASLPTYPVHMWNRHTGQYVGLVRLDLEGAPALNRGLT